MFNELKVVIDEVEVDFEFSYSSDNNTRDIREDIQDELFDIDEKLASNYEKIDDLDIEINKLTNHSDQLDNIIAVCSGVLAGIIDSLWVGEFSLERGTDWGYEKSNSFVKKIAKWQGYKGDDLQGAIRHLEKKFPFASDSNTMEFGGARQHHLRDFAHHPTILGLAFSLLTQFTGKSYGTSTNGMFLIVNVGNTDFIGKDIYQKIVFGTVKWFFHLVSDMAGSSNSPGAGTGLPGPLLAFVKKISALPFFNNGDTGFNDLSKWCSKLFNGTLFSERDENGRLIKESIKPFDFRAEIGLGYELLRQTIPVIINECIVRGFYFIRRLVGEIKEKRINKISELNLIDWKKTLPWNNRTIVRMLTISTTTFTIIDLGDAAIRGAFKSKGNKVVFVKEFLLRVNFVGVGRVVLAVGTDVYMGYNKNKLRDKRIYIFSEQLHLLNAKIYYKQADTWQAASKAENSINEVYSMMEKTSAIFVESYNANRKSMKNIEKYKDGIEDKNPRLIDKITNILNE